MRFLALLIALTANGCYLRTLAREGESHIDHSPPVHEQPSPVVMLSHAGPFDRDSAREALASTMVNECGPGGGGDVIVTFATDGSVTDVQIESAAYDESTATCIVKCYERIRMKPFSGKPHSVRWHIELPNAVAL
ncbi:MAG: hypothetical protein ACXVEF_43210 [Polyangiales bacterium]